MSLSETLLLAFSTYGLPALFVVTVMAAVGLPLPVTLLPVSYTHLTLPTSDLV